MFIEKERRLISILTSVIKVVSVKVSTFLEILLIIIYLVKFAVLIPNFLHDSDLCVCLYLVHRFFVGYKEEGKGTMEDWDQQILEKVVQSKINEYNKNKPTDIVSFQLLTSLLLFDSLGYIFSIVIKPCLLLHFLHSLFM
jgi:hypothetical protein